MKRYLSKLGNSRHILQFSLPRSGSTLVYNLLRELFPRRYIEKCHTLDRRNLESTIVATYRNPVDIVASLVLVKGDTFNDDLIREQAVLLHQQGLWDLLSIRDRPNLLLLRYEDFVDDFSVLFDSIESRFGIEIQSARRAVLTHQYSRESVQSQTRQHGDFSHYDRTTLFHGRHISRFNGAPDFSAHVFTPAQWERVACYFSLFMEEMGYAQKLPDKLVFPSRLPA